jgi:hypothetical protein
MCFASGCYLPTSASQVAGITALLYHAWIILWDGGLTKFLPMLDSNHVSSISGFLEAGNMGLNHHYHSIVHTHTHTHTHIRNHKHTSISYPPNHSVFPTLGMVTLSFPLAPSLILICSFSANSVCSSFKISPCPF